MSGKFIDTVANTEPKNRRGVSTSEGFSSDELSNPERLGDIIKSLSDRISSLEGNKPNNYIDIKKSVTSGDRVSIDHNFGSPARFYVVSWTGSTAPRFDEATTAPLSTNDNIQLIATCTGTVILRVEKSQW